MEQNKTWYIHSSPKSYEETKTFIEQYRQAVRRDFDRHMVMPDYIPQHSFVLDYGCGWGIFSEIVHQQRQCYVDGIDPDPHSIQVARDFVGEREGLSFSTQPVREIANETYDVVISAEVIEHTLNPGTYLQECNRVLKQGGYLVISFPNIMTPRYMLSALLGNAQRRFTAISETMEKSYDKTRHHIQAWDATTFCRLASALGFSYVTHKFMEGWALPKNLYWRHPWGQLNNWSCKVMFKLEKKRPVDTAMSS